VSITDDIQALGSIVELQGRTKVTKLVVSEPCESCNCVLRYLTSKQCFDCSRQAARERQRARRSAWSEAERVSHNEKNKSYREERGYNSLYWNALLEQESEHERLERLAKVREARLKIHAKYREEGTSYYSAVLKHNKSDSAVIARKLRQLVLHSLAARGLVKTDRSHELFGCSVDQLRNHLESQFQEGMTWENHGVHGWHIDHIVPCAAFNLTNKEDRLKCFHYSNLRPLWAQENWSKGANL
jgi:hypothetical protein